MNIYSGIMVPLLNLEKIAYKMFVTALQRAY